MYGCGELSRRTTGVVVTRSWQEVRAEAVARGYISEERMARYAEIMESELDITEEEEADFYAGMNAEAEVRGEGRQIPDVGWQCASGWTEILNDLHRELLEIYPRYTVFQIKEKFGGLRVYLDDRFGMEELEERMEERIRVAEIRASRTCEVCGEPGKLVGTSWYRTLCESHDRGTGPSYS